MYIEKMNIISNRLPTLMIDSITDKNSMKIISDNDCISSIFTMIILMIIMSVVNIINTINIIYIMNVTNIINILIISIIEKIMII